MFNESECFYIMRGMVANKIGVKMLSDLINLNINICTLVHVREFSFSVLEAGK
jgi:hypothetical protein